MQDCDAIYRRIEKELKLTQIGTEGNELANRMVILRPKKALSSVSEPPNKVRSFSHLRIVTVYSYLQA